MKTRNSSSATCTSLMYNGLLTLHRIYIYGHTFCEGENHAYRMMVQFLRFSGSVGLLLTKFLFWPRSDEYGIRPRRKSCRVHRPLFPGLALAACPLFSLVPYGSKDISFDTFDTPHYRHSDLAHHILTSFLHSFAPWARLLLFKHTSLFSSVDIPYNYMTRVSALDTCSI